METDPLTGSRRQSQSETLSAALRAIRLLRKLRAAEVAKAMNMPLRSYEHFEAGGGRIHLDKIHRFAEATDSDPYALLASLALGSPEFAVRCADNKLMMILMVALQEFDIEVGDEIRELEARPIINLLTKALRELGGEAVRRDPDADAWLAERLDRLTTPSLESD